GSMLIRVASSMEREKRYDATSPQPARNRRSIRASPACAIDEALVSNWKMFLKSGNGRRSSSDSAEPGNGWFKFNCLRKRVPFCPKYERFNTKSCRIGNPSDVLHCCRYGFANWRDVEKILGWTESVLSRNTVERSN